MTSLLSDAQLTKLYKFTESDLNLLGNPDAVSNRPDGSVMKKWSKERVEEFIHLPRVSLSQLKSEYGFSESWVKRIGQPDWIRPNPTGQKRAPMRLWNKDRVESFIEANKVEYAHWLEERVKRSATAKNVAERRRQATMAWAETCEVIFKPFPLDLKRAAEGYFSGSGEQGDRGIVAMLRHDYSNYESLIGSLKGQVGRYEAYYVIRKRIIQEICEKTAISYESDAKWGRGRPPVKEWGDN